MSTFVGIMAMLLILCVFLPLLLWWLDLLLGEKTPKEERTTLTGETYEDRKAWHDCGELSPGEHAMAQAIREHLQANPEWRKLMD